MRKFSIGLRGILLLTFVAAAATGCPDRRIVFITAPSQLDFGEDTEELTFNVSIAATEQNLAAFRVVSEVPWVTVLDCDELSDGCTTTGPNDPVPITLRVDRSRMVGGENEGRVRIEAPGVVSAFVDVSGFTPVVPAFSASDRTPFIDEVVTFTNQTTFAPGWFATDWFWQFRPNATSTLENPNPVLYPAQGSFTVTLRVTATNGTEVVVEEAVRTGFIVVANREAPTALFEANNRSPIVNNPVFFEDRSFPGTAPITSWMWDFGDGGTSRQQNPTHTYTLGGPFNVSLRVTSNHGTDVLVRESFINVIVRPPVADFTVDNRMPVVGEVIQFRDESEPGSAPITSWLWNFGDGGTSTQQNPVKVYTEPGVFSVRLTVTTIHGEDTETKPAFITVGTLPPIADFTVDNRRPLVGDTVTFIDTSDGRTAPVTEWFWDFGDGTTSTLEQPTHVYTSTGTFDVSLRVTTAHGEDFILKEDFIGVFEGTALDEYVRRQDDTFSFFPVRTLQGNGVTGHVLDLTSQTWRSPASVLNGGHIWSHWLVIIEPDVITHDTALLLIDGGSNNDDAPNSIDPLLSAFAVESQSVVAIVQQVPNQPLLFVGEPLGRSEDEILAFTFRQFLDSFNANPANPDFEWIVHLPMAKAAVRAMDATQQFLDDLADPVAVESFIVTGASKRGWTTWLAGAVDPRVEAIAPIVIDFLNFVPQIEHQFNVFGFFSEALQDYVDQQIFFVDGQGQLVNNFDTAGGAALREVADPFEYRGRFATVPKLLINSTGDQFFLPDSAQFYFDDLPGEKKLAYLPNTDHGVPLLGEGTEPGQAPKGVTEILAPWYIAQLNGQAIPQFDWTFPMPNQLVVMPQTPPSAARLWFASSTDRDFRFDAALNFPPPAWTAVPLATSGTNNITGFINVQPNVWTGYFIELEFPRPPFDDGKQNLSSLPFTFTTEVKVVPETFPTKILIGPSAEFAVSNASPPVGEAVQFIDVSAPGDGPIVDWYWDFGDGSFVTKAHRAEGTTTHTYAQAGDYVVTMTVVTARGESSASQMIIVTE